MTEEQRQAALSTIENIRNGIGTIIGKDVMDTIYEALQSPQPEVVTVEYIKTVYTGESCPDCDGADADCNACGGTGDERLEVSPKLIHFLADKYPHGIRIIREKSE